MATADKSSTPSPKATRRGGPSTFAGVNYQVRVAIYESLRLLQLVITHPQYEHTLTMEPRLMYGAGQVGFDMSIGGLAPRFVEVKLNPRRTDVADWLRRVMTAKQVTSEETTFVITYSKGSGAIGDLNNLIFVAHESVDETDFVQRVPASEGSAFLLKIIGRDARSLLSSLQAVQQPSDHMAEATTSMAAALTSDDNRSGELIELLQSRLTSSAETRSTIDLRSIEEEMTRRGTPLALAGRSGGGLADPVRRVLAVSTRCPTPLPVEVLARGLDLEHDKMVESLRAFVVQQDLEGSNPIVKTTVANFIDHQDTRECQRRVLAAILNLCSEPSWRHILRGQGRNIVMLGEAVSSLDPELVSSIFPRAEQIFKIAGDHHLALRAAQLSIHASYVHKGGPTSASRSMLMNRAQTQICGLCWVYQRTGKLDLARVNADESMKLGKELMWATNTAFCLKCIGRLRRIEAETSDPHVRQQLLVESEQLLREAFTAFSNLTEPGSWHVQMADCQCLLARTLFVAGRRIDAQRELFECSDVIEGQVGERVWADALILEAEILGAVGDVSEALIPLGEVLNYFNAESDPGEPTEISARALVARARISRGRRNREIVAQDMELAAEMYDRLEDPERRDAALWDALIERNGVPKELESSVRQLRPSVALAAVTIYTREVAMAGQVRGRRQGIPTSRLAAIISEAEIDVRAREPLWQ